MTHQEIIQQKRIVLADNLRTAIMLFELEPNRYKAMLRNSMDAVANEMAKLNSSDQTDFIDYNLFDIDRLTT